MDIYKLSGALKINSIAINIVRPSAIDILSRRLSQWNLNSYMIYFFENILIF